MEDRVSKILQLGLVNGLYHLCVHSVGQNLAASATKKQSEPSGRGSGFQEHIVGYATLFYSSFL